MSCPLGTISKRSRLEVCLEDRLQYELERTLNHPIPDRRNRKDADFAPVLRYFLLPSRQRHIVALIQFVPNLLKKRSAAFLSIASKVTPSTSRAPSVRFASAYASPSLSIFAALTYHSQAPQAL